MIPIKTITRISSFWKVSVFLFLLQTAIPAVYLESQELSFPNLPQDYLNQNQIFSDTLHKVVILGDISLVKTLLTSGVNPNNIDSIGWTPLDYAKKRNKQDIVKILLENGAKTFPKKIPDMSEGPHIRLTDSLNTDVVNLKYESKSGKSTLLTDRYPVSKYPIKIKEISIDPFDLDFKKRVALPSAIFKNVRKIFVVGDIHGEYDRVLGLLKENNIIDKSGNWCWGTGHLVFVGDVFDRGSKVTEALWLIFSLEKQALKSGGQVHLLLGNHEPMIFNNDLRYITNEYYSLCENLGLNYSGLFDEKSVLGHWLRQKPVIVQINDLLFLHAGVSPGLAEMKLALDTINKFVWQYFNNAEDKRNEITRQFILGSKGVLWYRGLIPEGSRKDVIDENSLNQILEFYNASAFVVGHTEVDSISAFFDKKVIDVNIPKGDDKIQEQGLLIKKKNKWAAFDFKNRKIL